MTRGSILILGLLIMAVLLLLGGIFLSLTTTNFFLLTVDNEKVNAFWIANAGVSQATHNLRRNYFNNEQRIFQAKFGNGLYRVGVITLRERGIHEILIISLGVSNYNGDISWNDIPASYQKYSIISEARIASPTDYLVFGNNNIIVGASPDLHQAQGFVYGGPIHSNGKIFLTGNGNRRDMYPGCDIIKQNNILGPAISSANIIFRESRGYNPNITYYWQWSLDPINDSNYIGEADINIGEGTVSFNGWTPNISYDKKFNLMNYSEFALAYKNGLPHNQIHDKDNSTEPTDPDYPGGISPDNTLDGLLMDKAHGGFYISVPSAESLSKFYKPLIDKKWVLTKENTNNLPKRTFPNEMIRQKHILGNYSALNSYNNYGILDLVTLGTGDGVKRDFSFFKINLVGWSVRDIKMTNLKSVLIDNNEYPVNQGAWKWGNVTASGDFGICAFDEVPGNNDVIYLGIQGRYRLGYGEGDTTPRTNWYIFPLAVDAIDGGAIPSWAFKQARTIKKVWLSDGGSGDNGGGSIEDATTTGNFGGPYTIRFYRWDSVSLSKKMLYNDVAFPNAGAAGQETKLGDLKTIYADMIEIKNGVVGVPTDASGRKVEVSLQFDNGETSTDLKPVDKANQYWDQENNNCKNEVIIPVGKGGLTQLSRAFSDGPGQNMIKDPVPVPDGTLFTPVGQFGTYGSNNQNGHYIFYSPYGAWNPAILASNSNTVKIEAGNATSTDRNKNCKRWGYYSMQLISVYVQENGAGVLIPCPYIVNKDTSQIGVVRFSSPPLPGKKVQIYPMMRIYGGLNDDGIPFDFWAAVGNGLPRRYYTVNPFTGSISTTNNTWDAINLRIDGSGNEVGWLNRRIGTDPKVEAYELDLGLIGSGYPDFPIDSQYASGWYDYNNNGKRDSDEDVYGIIYSEVPLIVQGTPKKPVTIVCTEDIYVKSINENYQDDDLSAQPVGLISNKAIWIAKWNGDVPGSAVTDNVILNRVSLYSQASGIYYYGGKGAGGRFKIIGSIYFGGVYFGNYYTAEHPEQLKNATYSYNQYITEPVYSISGYTLSVEDGKVSYLYATSFRGAIDTKDYRNIPPPNMPVDFKVIRMKEGTVDNVQVFLSQLAEYEKDQKIVTKDIYFDFIRR